MSLSIVSNFKTQTSFFFKLCAGKARKMKRPIIFEHVEFELFVHKILILTSCEHCHQVYMWIKVTVFVFYTIDFIHLEVHKFTAREKNTFFQCNILVLKVVVIFKQCMFMYVKKSLVSVDLTMDILSVSSGLSPEMGSHVGAAGSSAGK